jgi:hypothetical protein
VDRFTIHTARKRLLSIANVQPFVVQNLGKYERQLWQTEEFGANAAALIKNYTNFILSFYHAQPLDGFVWLHGLKGGRVVHVGAVDAPVTLADVKSISIEWQKNLGRSGAANNGIDVLGWEFAFEINETARQQAAEANVDLRFIQIPREMLEDKARKQGDIHFYEMAALSVEHKVKKRELTLKLTNFIAPLEYVPQDVRACVTKWEAWIDYSGFQMRATHRCACALAGQTSRLSPVDSKGAPPRVCPRAARAHPSENRYIGRWISISKATRFITNGRTIARGSRRNWNCKQRMFTTRRGCIWCR